MQNAKWDKPTYGNKLNHRHSERNEVETKNLIYEQIPRQARNDNAGQGNASSYNPSYNKTNVGAIHESPVYGDKQTGGLSRPSLQYISQNPFAILKEGLATAERKRNSVRYVNYSDGYDREEEALNFLADNIVYGSERDSNMVFSWGKRQKDAGEWLGEVFGEHKKDELVKRLDQKLDKWNYETHRQNGEKYKNYTSADFELPDVAQYKAEHNIGADDEELKNWETVLDVLQAGIDVAGLIPGVGLVPDLINTAIYAMRGDWKNAGFSALAALPVVGYLGTGGKYALKAADKFADVAKYSDDIIDATRVLGNLTDGAKYTDDAIDLVGGMAKHGDEAVEAIAKNVDDIADVGKNTDADIIKNSKRKARVKDEVETKKPYTNSRPSYATGQEEEVWRMYADPVTDTVIDPSGQVITWDRTKPRKGQWDMGHIPGQKYSDMKKKYMSNEISKEEFLAWYRNPKNYRPELPKTNRSHKFE